jgi:ABC-2 type transport system permease protein
MMLNSIFSKTLWDRRVSITWWTIGMVALAGLTVAFYPSIRSDAESFQSLFDAFPEDLLRVFGVEDAASLVTATGLVNSRLYAGFGPILVAVLGIGLGTSAIAGEEEDGTLDLLLSQPVTRTQVVVEKLVAGAALIGVVCMALFLTLSALNPVVDLGFSFEGILAANLTLWLFGMLFCCLAMAVGCFTGNRGLTIGASAATLGALFFINGLAPLVDRVAWLRQLTPFHWLSDPDPLANGFDLWSIVIFLALIGVFAGFSVWAFNRRDIAV